MGLGPIESIRFEDKADRTAFASDVKKKKPIEEIGAAMTGIGSMVGNFAAQMNSVWDAGNKYSGDQAGIARG